MATSVAPAIVNWAITIGQAFTLASSPALSRSCNDAVVKICARHYAKCNPLNPFWDASQSFGRQVDPGEVGCGTQVFQETHPSDLSSRTQLSSESKAAMLMIFWLTAAPCVT